jgi:type IV pilus assembly protein PilQ
MITVLKPICLGFLLVFIKVATPYAQEQGSLPSQKDTILVQQDILFVDSTIVVPLIDFRNTRISDILTALSKQYELNMWIDPEMDKLATIRLQDARLNDVITFFIDEYDLQFEKTAGLLRISSAPIPGPPRIVRCENGLLTLDVAKISVNELIRLLTDNCAENLVTTPGLAGNVSGYLKDAEFEIGLRAILNSNGFELVPREDLYMVTFLVSPAAGAGMLAGVTVQDGRISLNVINAGLRSVIDNIVDKTGLQVIIYGDIEGSITARCRGLSPDEALDYVLMGTKYTYSVEDSTYFIGPSTMAEITVTRLVKLKHLKAEGVIEMLPESLSSKATIKLIREHNGLMVLGPLQVANEIENYIAGLDHPPAQILIEALVVDYTVTDRIEYGVKAAGFPLGDSARPGQMYYPDIDVTGSSEQLNRDLTYWADKFNISNIGTLPADFYVRLNALAREGKANVRSRPRIATLNGHEAKIDVGTTQYYLLKTETTYGVGQQTPTTQVSEKFQTIEAAMSLTITPWVNASDEIIVIIHPEFNTPMGSFDPEVPPTINHRILDSTVRLRDGETIILGGLIQTTENETVEKFPILGDIPILGWLFKNKSKIKTNSELVIYLTPHIYYGSEGAVDISEFED